MDPSTQFGAAIATLLIFSVFSYGKKLLDIWGTFAADILGVAALLSSGIRAFASLIALYIFALLATKLGRVHRPRHETRGIANIIGNGGPAAICILAGNIPAFFGALSAALADTFSSEIGMTSKGNPVMITTLKEAQKGTDGAVSLRGFGASIVGATAMALVHYALFNPSLKMLALLSFAGVFGSVFDSVLGATLQRRGILGNNSVNFVASGAGALLVAALSQIILM